ncbi:chromosomal replication initiator protein DnaA [Desulfosarcina sp. OttesenSCG-928-B08]|nr:chromosomal replication initiator protein DnaA [Desulfosarcina sp. OttesenSCG-928-B08]
METIWTDVKNQLREEIPGHSYQMWIAPLVCPEDRGDEVVLACPNMFFKRRVTEHYGRMITDALSRFANRTIRVNWQVMPSAFPVSPEMTLPPVAGAQQMPLPNMAHFSGSGHLLRKDYTFDQFVVGKNSDFAYSAALSLAARTQGNQNALYLHAKTGLGKSHLSQAVGHHILSAFPNERVYYVTAEDFMNEMTGSYRSSTIHQFKEKYRRQCDVLLLEDVHFLSGKNGTQEELSSTLESLMNANKKIIYSSSYLPSEIPKLADTLKSRFSCGLISKIDPPDYAVRLSILKKWVKTDGHAISEEVLAFLASELTSDVRQLKSGLIGVTARASLLGTPVDLDLARCVVDGIAAFRKGITLDSIKQLVCKYYAVSMADLVSSSRRQKVVRPRQMAMYLCRQYTDHSLQTIGKSFNRYHATALHAMKAVEKEIRENGPFQKQAAFLSERLEKGAD